MLKMIHNRRLRALEKAGRPLSGIHCRLFFGHVNHYKFMPPARRSVWWDFMDFFSMFAFFFYETLG
jgi:hypothetical protein